MWRANICRAWSNYCCFYGYLFKQNLNYKINSGLPWYLITHTQSIITPTSPPPRSLKNIYGRRLWVWLFILFFNLQNSLLTLPRWSCVFAHLSWAAAPAITGRDIMPHLPRKSSHRASQRQHHKSGGLAGSPPGGIGKKLTSSLPLPTKGNLQGTRLMWTRFVIIRQSLTGVPVFSRFTELSISDALTPAGQAVTDESGRIKMGMFSRSEVGLACGCCTHR